MGYRAVWLLPDKRARFVLLQAWARGAGAQHIVPTDPDLIYRCVFRGKRTTEGLDLAAPNTDGCSCLNIHPGSLVPGRVKLGKGGVSMLTVVESEACEEGGYGETMTAVTQEILERLPLHSCMLGCLSNGPLVTIIKLGSCCLGHNGSK